MRRLSIMHLVIARNVRRVCRTVDQVESSLEWASLLVLFQHRIRSGVRVNCKPLSTQTPDLYSVCHVIDVRTAQAR